MQRRKQLTQFEMVRIVGVAEFNVSLREIGRKFNRSTATIISVWKRFVTVGK
jgi:IS30 family transposase